MFSQAIGHGATVYTVTVDEKGVATVSFDVGGDPHTWGVPAGQQLTRADVPTELRERLNRVIAEGRYVKGVRSIDDESTVQP